MLNDSQLEQFKTDGYTVAPGFFDAAEVTTLQGELERLKTEGLGRNVSTDGDGESHSTVQVNLQIIPLSPVSDVFRALPFAAKVRAAVTELIGDDALMQLDQIFLKPAQHGAGTSWHQDNHYFGIADPTQGVGMWVAVHDACIANGTMHVVPRSHEKVLEHIRDMGSDHHFYCRIDEEEDEIVPIEMKAGGALFFNYGIAHCTLGNNTDRERAGLALHFLKGEYRDLIKQAGGIRPNISGPNYTRGLTEWGEVQEGLWEKMCTADAAV